MGGRSAGTTLRISVLLAAISLLAADRGWAMQTVFLDFDTFSSSGGHAYSPADRMAVKAGLEAIYPPGLGVSFTTTPPPGTHSTVYFNFGEGPYGGTSDHVDFLNTDTSDDAYVLAKPLLASMSIPDTVPNILRASTNLAAHELGHILGLRHYDSFGPPYGGMPAGIADDFFPVYPGPTLASSTTDHVMSLSSTIGLSAGNLLDPDIHFGFREAIKLKMAGHAGGLRGARAEDAHDGSADVVYDDQRAEHDASASGRISLPRAVLFRGGRRDRGHARPVSAGSPMMPPGPISTDYYQFSGMAGETVTIEVMSSILSWRLGDVTDPVVFLLDGMIGLPVGTYFTNDDEHETTDSMLLDITLPYTGPYVIEVGPFDPFVPAYAGAYDLYVYRYTTIPEPTRWRCRNGRGA